MKAVHISGLFQRPSRLVGCWGPLFCSPCLPKGSTVCPDVCFRAGIAVPNQTLKGDDVPTVGGGCREVMG